MNTMKKKLLTTVIAAIFVLALTAANALAAPIGFFTDLQGSVDVLRAGDSKAVPVKKGDPIFEGDIVRTKHVSAAALKMTDGSTINLAQNTRMEIKNYTLDEGGRLKHGVANLFRGKLRKSIVKSVASLTSSTGYRFETRTPNATVGVKGTIDLTYYNNGITGEYVEEGDVDVWNNNDPNNPQGVGAGLYSIVGFDNPPTDPNPYGDASYKSHVDDTTPGRADRSNFMGAGPDDEDIATPSYGDEEEDGLGGEEFAGGEELPVTETNPELLAGRTFTGNFDLWGYGSTNSDYFDGNGGTASGMFYGDTSGTWDVTVSGTYASANPDTSYWGGGYIGNATLSDGMTFDLWNSGGGNIDRSGNTWTVTLSGCFNNSSIGWIDGTISGTISGGPNSGTYTGSGGGTWTSIGGGCG